MEKNSNTGSGLAVEANRLVRRVREYEIDHEPEGWPAVQMQFVSDLAETLDAYRQKLEFARQQLDKIYCETTCQRAHEISNKALIHLPNAADRHRVKAKP